jgi:hypothetical protein
MQRLVEAVQHCIKVIHHLQGNEQKFTIRKK